MADSPTRSLRPAPNAAARMQEVLRRPADPPSLAAADDSADSRATALPDNEATALLPSNATTLPEGSATDGGDGQVSGGSNTSEEGQRAEGTGNRLKNKPSPASTRKPTPKVAEQRSNAVAEQHGSAVADTTSSLVSSATRSDPVRQAMLGMLAQPYPADMADGPMTVTSVKIPKPIWERLEYVRAITRKDKQDIIAEALRLYFDRIVAESAE